MFRRKLFFWLDRMKITPAERKAVAGSLLLLLLLLLVNASVSPPAPYDERYYRALEEEFERRAALIDRRQEELYGRFHPGEEIAAGGPVPLILPDTLTPDTLSGDSLVVEQADSTLIDLNSAGAELLQELPGIGPVYAERIIRWRTEAGPFRAVEELLQIRGIGEKRLEKIKPFVKI